MTRAGHYLVAVIGVIAVFAAISGGAQVPHVIAYQGRLLDSTNLVNAVVPIAFRLYPSESGGSPVYSDSNDVAVADGLYSAVIGDDESSGLIRNALTNAELWLEVEAAGLILSPRERFVSAGYAEIAGGFTNGTVTQLKIADGGVGVAALADGSITRDKLTADCVDTNALAAGSVGTAKMADTCVTSNAIAAGAVGPTQLLKQYLSGSVVVPFGYTGSVTNFVADFAPAFEALPSVNLGVSSPGALPINFACPQLVLTSRSLTNFAARIVISPHSDPDFGAPRILYPSNYYAGDSQKSLKIVSGNPAIGYYEKGSALDLLYVHSADISGGAWGPSVPVDTNGDVGMFNSMEVIDGSPAIAYLDSSNHDLKYARASDPTGAVWEMVLAVDTNDIWGSSSLAVVAGRPAISYYDLGSNDLMYIRANDATGGTWGARIRVDSTGAVGGVSSLAVVNGNPAISYSEIYSGADLKYVRANDSTGGVWGGAIRVDQVSTIYENKLLVVDGRPAIAYVEMGGTNDLKYVRALDANGTAWGTPVRVDTNDIIDHPLTFKIIDGRPAILYEYNHYGLWFVQANDATGGTWGTPVVLVTNGSVASMEVVNGQVALAYRDMIVDTITNVLAYFTVTSATVNVDWIAVEP